ncbi:hypothetical protein Godav_007911 [Gossypium davidsonii]|uniref:DDE Tnp4 domain-containing protein n=2 Tax=Gossypium TaxID=3633 RepID=A0A7J8S8C3_GOSDV|nr:hypothetical protein [Gossypium davidsonii]MBA0657868.1 hypothetical protein [Gossypium klotzschianum]
MINGENYKRRREETFSDDEDSCSTDNEPKKKDLNGIITSLLLLEEQEKRDHEEQNEASNEEKSILESNHKRKTRTMLEFYTNLQDYYSEIDETDRVKRKKSRTMAESVAVAAVSQTENQSPNQQNKQSGSGQQRRLWVKDRSKAWWDDCNRPDYPEEEFKKAFRMSKSTFELICEELNSVIAKEDTTVLMPKYLHWPEEDSLRKIKEEFEGISGIPNVVGSMYTTHIPIIAPKISVAAYFNKRHTERNQKTSYSITVQGVVDPRGVFTDVCIGWPGSMTDDQVLEKSALYQRANGGLLKGVWIVGSSGYPLMDWVLVPYTKQHLTWTQHAFNEKIGEIQKIAKEAFGRLKGRWCCLQKRTEVKLQDLPVVLGACCVLHNICEMMDEGIDPDLKFALADDEMVPEVALKSVSSMKARDAIAHNLLHHGLAGTAFL